MKVKILKSFWKGEEHFEKGEIAEVSNNFAFGLIENGFAIKLLEVIKEIEKPKRNKMISKKRKITTK